MIFVDFFLISRIKQWIDLNPSANVNGFRYLSPVAYQFTYRKELFFSTDTKQKQHQQCSKYPYDVIGGVIKSIKNSICNL